jgi:hypothetical protein
MHYNKIRSSPLDFTINELYCIYFFIRLQKSCSRFVLWWCGPSVDWTISKRQPTILMNFEHNDSWLWIKVVLIWGYCIPFPFSNKKPQDAKMDVSIIYKWRIYFSSGFHVCVLMNSLVLLCHYYWFSQKGGNFKFLTLTFYPILMQFFWGAKWQSLWIIKKIVFYFEKEPKFKNFSYLEDK